MDDDDSDFTASQANQKKRKKRIAEINAIKAEKKYSVDVFLFSFFAFLPERNQFPCACGTSFVHP